MGDGRITATRQGGILRLTLDRPDKANALTAAMLTALLAELRNATEADRAVVLAGAGGTFSAGADLGEAADGLATSGLWEDVSRAVADLPGLSIAALNGPCAGGAMGMALACDLRIATRQARFFYPVLRLGYLPQPSDPARLAALVGPARARLILLGGARIDAAEALTIGLVDRLCDDPDAAVDELSAAAIAAPPGHLRAIGAMIPDIRP
ncbi:hypothetical protein OCGS_1350 [Oceaniovalibus guishaninsula JLT2003]|uniref:Enoyl-CoA hydratase/isomerase family protein n=1 Tax=Oceaniovalibus guishaninsula JLT2003 TaxID=1231392 RepID=K2HD56_9RHOB|nr:enoyl-CoA hydratase/isomerase family protein [Oceaniovalibus guishaninsula]EKE44512.1 hypothetical protein OCGS_1350 [Oceaniovalibus guishaninsula JLT2003]